MRFLMKSLLSAVALALVAGAAPAAEATTRIAVTGLTCPSCSYIVATAMKRVESVEILSFTEAEDDAELKSDPNLAENDFGLPFCLDRIDMAIELADRMSGLGWRTDCRDRFQPLHRAG